MQGVLGSLLAGARQRLERDLLPRLAGEAGYLVVGLVGPNNAGKSALHSALAGRVISPSRARGGATRRLVGAAHPRLCARLEAAPSARFLLRRVDVGPGGTALALDEPERGDELLLVEAPELSEGLLLIDAPDFDSIQEGNRSVAEALLRVTDLALVVVTRHTYQNREVIDFLEGWLAHGRPWACVYNEALEEELTRAHLAKLASDVGCEPEAAFAAPLDEEIAEGRASLVPRGLAGRPEAGLTLARWLFDPSRAEELEGRALAAGLAQLADELGRAHAALQRRREALGAIEERVRVRAGELGKEVAAGAMPMGPFLEAFRAVLDRRPGRLRRAARGALRRAAVGAGALLGRLRGRSVSNRAPADERLVERERALLASAWPPFFEALAGELGELARGQEDLEATLGADLAAQRLAPAGEEVAAALALDEQVLGTFGAACEELIEGELKRRSDEWLMQIGIDALHLLPALTAGVVIVKTGGLGADLAVGGAGAVSSLVAERVSRLLGTSVAHRARRHWSELRGPRLATAAIAAALPRTWPRIVGAEERDEELAARLERALEELG